MLSPCRHILCVALFACILGCQQASDVVAEVNDHPIMIDDLRIALQAKVSGFASHELNDTATLAAEREHALTELIDTMLMERALRTQDIIINQDMLADYLAQFGQLSFDHAYERAAWKAAQRRNLVKSRYVETFIAPFIWIDEQAVKRHYTDHADYYTQRKAVRARHILVSSRVEAENIRQAILDGANFAQLAIEHSASPEASAGGLLGWIEQGQYPEIFEETCFALPTGAMSAVVASEYGYHLFKTLEKRKQQITPLADARPDIIRTLKNNAQWARLPMHLDNLRFQAKIATYPDIIAALTLQPMKDTP